METHSYRAHFVTWNLMSTNPLSGFNYKTLIGCDDQYKYEDGDFPDFYIFGFQESNILNLADFLIENSWLTELKSNFVKLHIKGKGPKYVKFTHRRELGLLLIVYIRKEHIFSIRNLRVSISRFGIMNMLPNKASITLNMEIDGITLWFTNSHLSAHEPNYYKRVAEFKQICTRLEMDFSERNDQLMHCWIGDLNFRLKNVPSSLYTLPSPPINIINEMLNNDQLKLAQRDRQAFQNFTEQAITFMPTYKFILNSDAYSEKRTPSYTDRVLFRCHSLQLKPVAYRAVQSLKQSDHRPVISILDFTGQLNIKRKVTVQFDAINNWNENSDNGFTYIFVALPTCEEPLRPLAWDWIGLYKENFYSLDDYVAFIYVEQTIIEPAVEASDAQAYTQVENSFRASFSGIYPNAGSYVYVYVRRDGCVYGQSRAFMIE